MEAEAQRWRSEGGPETQAAPRFELHHSTTAHEIQPGKEPFHMRDTFKEHAVSRTWQACHSWFRTSPWALIVFEVGVVIGLWAAVAVVR